MNYKSAWWSVELPPNWRGYPDADCTTFRTQMFDGGALQISAARKDTGLVTDQDLQEFACDRLAAGAVFDSVRFRECSGFTTRYRKDGVSWQEWWLKSEHLMIYATYNVVPEKEYVEQDDVASILSSLASLTSPRDDNPHSA
jgi:hypothetical protein